MESFFNRAPVNFTKNIIVGKNDIADFRTVQEALDSCEGLDGPVKITVLSGEYRENLHIYQSCLLLEGIGGVKIIGSRYAREIGTDGREIGTFQTATLFINAADLVIKNIEVINDAGPGEQAGQAVALYNQGDRIDFIGCSFKGFQDTICLGPLPEVQKNGQPFSGPELKTVFNENRVRFLSCYAEGTVDFIFGGGEALFQFCEIKSLKRPDNQEGYITAASTLPEKEGFQFQQCYLTAEADVENVYLGRPWRPYAKTSFSSCRIGPHLHHDHWDDWRNRENRKTVDFREYGNIYADGRTGITKDWIKSTNQTGK
jgi:pectinesterase